MLTIFSRLADGEEMPAREKIRVRRGDRLRDRLRRSPVAGGRAADLLGRRRILMLGLAVLTGASLGAGLATGGSFLSRRLGCAAARLPDD
jgi:hypothetical protein